MIHVPVRFVTESLGIAPQTAAREPQRRPISRYADRGRASRSLRGLETRGTAGCCIRSKSSRFTLHPFREGNGRTQRVFWTLIARDAGWGLDWSQVSKHENDIASFIAHENVDYSRLEAMFDKIVQPLPPKQDRRLLPAIGFKPGIHDDSATPNVYQALSASEYEQQKQRYRYQTRRRLETQAEEERPGHTSGTAGGNQISSRTPK